MITAIVKRILLIIIVLIISGIITAYYLNRSTDMGSDVSLDIKRGMTLSSVSIILEKKEIIRSRYFFIILSYIKGTTVKSGSYVISKGMTTSEILNKLGSGRSLSKKVTIPEGSNIYEIAEILDNNGIVDGPAFVRACRNRSLLSKLGIKAQSIEGYLFPDTYFLKVKQPPSNVIKIMAGRFRAVMKEVRASVSSDTDLSESDMVKLASLIEEEARIPKERKYISSVFHNRLKKGMKLDCDPTVRYAVNKFRGKIYYRDLDSDSPYNTYKHRGLPPTAITNPGRSSLIAAMKPADTDFLFFVARNDGSHYFSERLSVHNRAVQKFQRGKNNGFIDRQKLN